MKFFLSGSTILLLIIFSSLEGGLSSCTKDKTIFDTVIVTKKDTLIKVDTLKVHDTTVLKDTFLTTALLTAHSWKLQELRGVMQGTIIYYLRGSGTNVINYDNEYLTFNADKTGSYVDANGASRVIGWDFANAQDTKITFTIFNTPANLLITWENVRYKDNSLYYDEYYNDGNTGYNWHGQGIRIPK